MRLLNFFILFSFSLFCLKAQLYTYPEGLRTGIPHNDDFTVRVRTKGGEWKETFETQGSGGYGQGTGCFYGSV